MADQQPLTDLNDPPLMPDISMPPNGEIPNGSNGADIEMKEEPMSEAPNIIPPAESLTQPAPTSQPQLPQPSQIQQSSQQSVGMPSATAPPQAATPPVTTPGNARGSPHPTSANVPAPPTNPNPHGSPTRMYLNQQVTPYLLEAMKQLAIHEPEKPLKYLAEFLAEKSRELEGP